MVQMVVKTDRFRRSTTRRQSRPSTYVSNSASWPVLVCMLLVPLALSACARDVVRTERDGNSQLSSFLVAVDAVPDTLYYRLQGQQASRFTELLRGATEPGHGRRGQYVGSDIRVLAYAADGSPSLNVVATLQYVEGLGGKRGDGDREGLLSPQYAQRRRITRFLAATAQPATAEEFEVHAKEFVARPEEWYYRR
jgi:hypothetical protein